MKQKKDTRHVRGIVDSLLRKWESGTLKKGNAVWSAWSAAVTEEDRGHARPVSLKNGTLMVIAENSSWLYKLTMEKKNILEKFNANYEGRKKAKDIRFRIGDLSA
jgi:predicted nucleic acid-binding Zn ribbon protein